MTTYLVSILCVIGLAVGQLLFKLSAIGISEGGSFFRLKPAIALFAAMCLYGITSLAWVWVLQKVELGRVYPFMSLAFILVPMGSHFFYGERFHPQYFLGVAILIVGIIITVKS